MAATAASDDGWESYEYYREQYILHQQQQQQRGLRGQQALSASGSTSLAPPALDRQPTYKAFKENKQPLASSSKQASRPLPKAPVAPPQQQQLNPPLPDHSSRPPLQPQLNWDNSPDKPSFLRRLTPQVALKRSESDRTYARQQSEAAIEEAKAASARASSLRKPRKSELAAAPEARPILAQSISEAEQVSLPADSYFDKFAPLLEKLNSSSGTSLTSERKGSQDSLSSSSSLAADAPLADYRAPATYTKPTKPPARTSHSAMPLLPKRGTTLKMLRSLTGSGQERAPAVQDPVASLPAASMPTVIKPVAREREQNASAAASKQLRVGDLQLPLPLVAVGGVGVIVVLMILRAILTFSASVMRLVVLVIVAVAGFYSSRYAGQMQQRQQGGAAPVPATTTANIPSSISRKHARLRV